MDAIALSALTSELRTFIEAPGAGAKAASRRYGITALGASLYDLGTQPQRGSEADGPCRVDTMSENVARLLTEAFELSTTARRG